MMKHIVLLTHGHLLRRLRFCTAGHFSSDNPLTLLCMEAQDSPDTMHSRVHQVLERFPAADPVILMTDIPVGRRRRSRFRFWKTTPTLYIVTGLNLGLLLEVALNPMEDDVSTILREAVEASRQTLLFINDQLDSDEE